MFASFEIKVPVFDIGLWEQLLDKLFFYKKSRKKPAFVCVMDRSYFFFRVDNPNGK